MRRQNHTLTAAICVSLILHFAAMMFIIRAYGRDLIAMIPAWRISVVAERWQSEFGEDGAGESLNYSEGNEQMRARQGTAEQVQLSRDPVGAGAIGDLPSPSVLPMGEQSTEASPAQPPPPQATAVPSPFGAQAISTDFTPPTPKPRTNAQAIKQTAAMPPADPAPDRGTETDAFAKNGSVDFRAGKAEARLGRKVKTVRPRFDLAGQWDAIGLNAFSVQLKANIDEGGHVTNVEFLKSSGSNSIDQPIKVAVYQWEFEPAKNAAGKAVPDVLTFTIGFH